MGIVGGSHAGEFTLAGMSSTDRFVLFTDRSAPFRSQVYARDMRRNRTTLVSATSIGASATDMAAGDAISPSGRYCMFSTRAANVVPGDTNRVADVFVRDRRTHRTHRISISSAGRQADARSGGLGISADGRYRLFWSQATNLVPGDTNHHTDIFLRDARTGRTVRVDLRSTGAQQANPLLGTPSTAAVSADGAFVVWASAASGWVTGDTNGVSDVFARGPLH